MIPKHLCLCLLAIASIGNSQAEAVSPPVIFPGEPTPVPEEKRQELEDSYAKWIDAKEQSGGNYSYQVTFASFSGYRSTTTITATRGIVSRRTFEETIPPFFTSEPRNYVEEGDEVGTNPRGAPPLTMEQLYEIARGVLQGSLNPYERLVLSFDARGLLQNCFTYNSLIADDVAINGVSIANLTLLPRLPGASDSDSDEDHSQETVTARSDRTPFLRTEIKRLKFALRDAKRIQDPRRKREVIKRIKRQIRKRSQTLG